MQVLSEQCRRLGIGIEASSAHIAALSEARGVARKKPAWNLDISSIHRRIKEDMRTSQRTKTGAGEPPPYNGDSSLPPGWEVQHFTISCSVLFIGSAAHSLQALILYSLVILGLFKVNLCVARQGKMR